MSKNDNTQIDGLHTKGGLILIADSGSTSTDWGLAQGSVYLRRIRTQGMNPYFQTAADMDAILRRELLPELGGCRLEAVYFYGAGCGTEAKKRFTEDNLEAALLAPAVVESDMLGAARALLGRQRGIACILGTGSNSCLFDGERIIDQVPALGFILGDEGSGASLGKLLMGQLFKRKLPQHLADKLRIERKLNLADLLENTYKRPFPSRYLASLAPFLRENMHEEEVRAIVLGSFRSFFERNVMQYEGYEGEAICFTGSVAYHFAEALQEAAHALSLQITAIARNPMDGLAQYHAGRK